MARLCSALLLAAESSALLLVLPLLAGGSLAAGSGETAGGFADSPAAKLMAWAAELPFAAGVIPEGPASSGGGTPRQTWSPSLSLLSASGSACPAATARVDHAHLHDHAVAGGH